MTLIFQEPDEAKLRKWVLGTMALPARTSFFTWLEMESTILVRLRQFPALADRVSDIRQEQNAILHALTAIYPNDALLRTATNWLNRFHLRAGDALQLASALSLLEDHEEVCFVCFDKKLSQAANECGLAVPFPASTS